MARKEYSDREPIMEHEEVPNEDVELFAVPKNDAKSPFEPQNPSANFSSLMDLEFGNVFNYNSTSITQQTSHNQQSATSHPTPSSIFDDL